MSADHDASVNRHELASVLRDLAWTIQRLVPEEAGLDPLPTTELAVIKHIQASPGVTVGELAKYLAMQQSNVSAAVRELVQRGLVSRERSSADRRVTRLVPTEKSLAAKEAINRVWSGTIQSALRELSDERVLALESASDALRALDDALHAARSLSAARISS